MGRLLGGEHASTPQSGVEAPSLLKRSLPDCIVVVVVVVVVGVGVGVGVGVCVCVCVCVGVGVGVGGTND